MKFIHTGFRNSKILAIIVLAVLLRVGAAVYLGDRVVPLPGTYDQKSYHSLALRVIDGYGFTFGENWWPATAAGEPTAHWSYLYTLYLVTSYAIFGSHPLAARLLQAVGVGILHPFLTYRIGRRVFGETVGLVAAGIVAIYTYFVYYAAVLMTESFYIVGILSSLIFTIALVDAEEGRRDGTLGAGLGLSLGLTVLLRQLFLLLAPFLFAWLWWARFRKGSAVPLKSTVIAGALLVGMIAPVTVFNYTRFERFVLVNTNAGYAFFWGNHPVYGTKFIPARNMENYQDLIPQELRDLNEAELDVALLKLSFEFILDDPVRYLLLSVSRIPEYFRFWPSTESEDVSNISRVVSFGLILPLMLAGSLLSLKQKVFSRGGDLMALLASPIALLLGYAGIYTLVHLMSWALVRYRLPVDAVLILFAGLALSQIGNWMIDRNQISLMGMDKKK